MEQVKRIYETAANYKFHKGNLNSNYPSQCALYFFRFPLAFTGPDTHAVEFLQNVLFTAYKNVPSLNCTTSRR